MPKDPRAAIGACQNPNPWTPPLSAWQTGGAGAGTIASTVQAALAWPPSSISNGGAATLIPTYTPTGPVPTLPAPTFSGAGATVKVGNGWQNPSDTAGDMVAIATCSYLDPWIAPSAAAPSPLCSGAAKREEVSEPVITPPP
jgi:hypothetical protein